MKIFLLALCVGLMQNSYAQDTIYYSISFPNAVHHEAEVIITYPGVQSEFLRLVMSNFSPGRYANHQFAKNVYGLKAFSGADEPLSVHRNRPNEWLVEVKDGYVRVFYTLYAHHADGTYSGIDRHFAHLNIPSSLVWAEGLADVPIKLSVHFPDETGWEVATQLHQIKPNETYLAPNLAYLMDSPIAIGQMDSREWAGPEGKKISLVINPDAEDDAEDLFFEMTKKVVQEQRAIFGEFPNFEFGEYTFLCNYGHGYHPDGMEHRNSTMITNSVPLAGNEVDLIGTVAHEFFHAWNVERLRPKSLEPFSFKYPSMPEELWFAEGFTTYYTPLTLRRAGIIDDSLFAGHIQRLFNYVALAPGTGKYPPVEMSAMAVYTDASAFVDPTNLHNHFTSYYPYGAVLGLALDLELRIRADLSLDGYMKHLWQKFGRDEIPYTGKDLENELANYSREPDFARQFFEKYVYGSTLPDLEPLLRKAGFSLQKRDSSQNDLGRFQYAYDVRGIIFRSNPVEKSTPYMAGINANDIILTINERAFSSVEDFQQYTSTLKPGQVIRFEYLHHEKRYKADAIVKPDRTSTLQSEASLTEEQLRFREAWLGSKAEQ